ncbi:MAG: 5'/3'-nucleotidase SurE [Bacillota bacterium]|nr:5'/3'-nucleotidase SurE [Bacillota bacterium]
MELNILLANDDGIDAQGLHELAESLGNNLGANIYVFAPEGQRSGASHSISLRTSVDVWVVPFEGATRAFAVSGTPSDCVAVGLHCLREKGIEVDLVFAGINHGSNVGTDTLYSGTVGAAMEGCVHGIPSVAVSVDSHQATEFRYACKLAVDTVRKTGGKWNSEILININTPNLPEEEIKGVKYTTIGDREYSNDVQATKMVDNVTTYVYGGDPVHYGDNVKINDVIAIQNGYASISLLKKDISAYEEMNKLDDWRIGK